MGLGRTGTAVAQRVIGRNYGEVLLVERDLQFATGRAQDLNHMASVDGFTHLARAISEPKESADSDLVIVCVGVLRTPDSPRSEQLVTNLPAVRSIVHEWLPLSPEAVTIIVSNPVDVLTYVAATMDGADARRVVGCGAVTDEAFLRTVLARRIGVPSRDVTTVVLGPHNRDIVPLYRCSAVNGIPLSEFMDEKSFDAAVEEVRSEGDSLTRLVGYSPFAGGAAATMRMVDAVMNDEHAILSSAIALHGEYGLSDVCVSVPVELGLNGVTRVIEMELSSREQAALENAAASVRNALDNLAVES